MPSLTDTYIKLTPEQPFITILHPEPNENGEAIVQTGSVIDVLLLCARFSVPAPEVAKALLALHGDFSGRDLLSESGYTITVVYTKLGAATMSINARAALDGLLERYPSLVTLRREGRLHKLHKHHIIGNLEGLSMGDMDRLAALHVLLGGYPED